MEKVHRQQHHQNGDHQHEDGDHRATEVKEEDDAHQADDDHLLDQLLFQGRHGAQDKVRAVVDGHNLHTVRQLSFVDLSNLLLDFLEDSHRIDAVSRNDYSTCYLPFAIEFRQTTTHLGTEVNVRYVSQINGSAPVIGSHNDFL